MEKDLFLSQKPNKFRSSELDDNLGLVVTIKNNFIGKLVNQQTINNYVIYHFIVIYSDNPIRKKNAATDLKNSELINFIPIEEQFKIAQSGNRTYLITTNGSYLL